jgi:transposase
MRDVNKERLSRITQLRAKGATITQIAAATGYPRSSVGHYVKKYCGGKTVASKPQDDKSAQRLLSYTTILPQNPNSNNPTHKTQHAKLQQGF